MIVVYHQNNRVTKVVFPENNTSSIETSGCVATVLLRLAQEYPASSIVWCHQLLENSLNKNRIATLFHHHKMMLSYSLHPDHFLGNYIGFVEESPFIKVNEKCTYPTWLMSSDVGVIHGSVLQLIGEAIQTDTDFDYFLNSVANIGMFLGLLCYSEPQLILNNEVVLAPKKASLYVLFRFVKQHYKKRWIALLFLNLLIFENRFALLPATYGLFFKSRKQLKLSLDSVVVHSAKVVVTEKTIDVIIPTIGRKSYLYDVLQDLAQQTHLPIQVIIIEQNPQPDSVSELDFKESTSWPFKIKHTFTHQAGACNARNLALGQVESEWVFMADDDIRIESEFLSKAIKIIEKFGVKAVSLRCIQQNEVSALKNVFQWGSFGSGCSIVANPILKNTHFNLGYEFGYGEDSDFGMQLRNQGNDILFLPEPSILHLKAPVGGFRTKPILMWSKDAIQPKPSPTVLLFQISHNTKEQILGYKTILFLKYYKHQNIKNPFKYYINFKEQWNRSLYWANQLKKTQ